MLLVLSVIPYLRSNTNSISFFIEEPEAHLFPQSQQSIIEMITCIYNSSNKSKSNYIITTHSPYVLITLNLLAKAGIIYEKIKLNTSFKIEEMDKIIPDKYKIPPKHLIAYYIDSGTARNIINEETGLVNDELIDEISEISSVKFEELLELEVKYGL